MQHIFPANLGFAVQTAEEHTGVSDAVQEYGATCHLALEYLKVILSAPVIAGLTVGLCLYLFNGDIKALMLRIAKIKFPGGGELSTSQSERIEESKPAPMPPREEAALPPTLKLTQEQVTFITNILSARGAEAALWEMRYLNLYLVPHTQRVLDWLIAQSGATTLSLFESAWLPIIPDANEREVVLDALCSHRLVEREGNTLLATDRGRAYAGWRGPTPEAPKG